MDKHLQVVIIAPYTSFREKISITKEFDGKAKMEVFDQYVYIEQTEVEI